MARLWRISCINFYSSKIVFFLSISYDKSLMCIVHANSLSAFKATAAPCRIVKTMKNCPSLTGISFLCIYTTTSSHRMQKKMFYMYTYKLDTFFIFFSIFNFVPYRARGFFRVNVCVLCMAQNSRYVCRSACILRNKLSCASAILAREVKSEIPMQIFEKGREKHAQKCAFIKEVHGNRWFL